MFILRNPKQIEAETSSNASAHKPKQHDIDTPLPSKPE